MTSIPLRRRRERRRTPLTNLATQAGNSHNKKTVLSGFKAHRVDSSKHLQDANREPEDNKKAKRLDFKAHHVGSGKHLQDNQKAKRLDFTTHQVGSSKHLLEPS